METRYMMLFVLNKQGISAYFIFIMIFYECCLYWVIRSGMAYIKEVDEANDKVAKI